ncbi:hypothetical protein OPT61_g1865 [Boeremia exigua]|uniref:Uncharacterized protein n=1 Tax=Boeremia exigua TaxID=749465 RepID=A0ACC2INK5_9PLEO|nr:hypothetical protein OPT61_g1865 [Boeremia exigua]
MIFQRRFHSHAHTTVESPPPPPPKNGGSSPKTLEEILAIAVSPRAPKPPPHAAGTVANSRVAKNSPLRSASSPVKSNVPKRAPSSRKIGHATIHTDAMDGHDAFESDAFAVHMPTTRVPIIDAVVSRAKPLSPNKAQAEAVQTYKEKAKEAREKHNNTGVRVPPNIASYDYAYANTMKADIAIPDVLKPSNSPPAPAGAFPVSPPVIQERWTRSEPKLEKSKTPSNTSVYRKPTVLGVTTSAAVLEESVRFVRADSKGGASRPTTPPRSTTVKISMKPKTPSLPKAQTIPAIKIQTCQDETSSAHTCKAQHRRGVYYRSPHVESAATSRSPSPTKTMPNFARQYSVEGDSIFGYKVKDSLGTIGGADKSASNSSEDEKPKAATSKTPNAVKPPSPKRTLTDRWPWIRKGATVGKPPSTPAPDPPVKAPSSSRPRSIYVSPFEASLSPPTTSPPVRPVARSVLSKNTLATTKTATPPTPAPTSASFDRGLQQIQSFVVLALKVGLALYVVIALWFILDAIREALCVVFVPLHCAVMFAWAMVSFAGRGLSMAAETLNGKIRVLGR